MIREAARRLPRPAQDALRRARTNYRRARYRLRARLRPVRLDADDVETGLREAGVGPGDTIFLQAAMSAFGTFENGPETILEAARRVLGDDGLMAMPSYPMALTAIEHLASDPVFDVRETPSGVGAVSEAFRRAPDTTRSVHPTHPVAARGKGAGELVEGHLRASCQFEEGTPFSRLVERDAHQIFFGTTVTPLTIYHPFECMRQPPFPLDVFAERRIDARCVDWDGEEHTVPTLVHNPALLPTRIDHRPHLQTVFRDALLESGARSVSLGRGEILAIRLQPMFEMFERLIRDGVTIYDVPLPAEQPRQPPQERVER